MPVYEVTIPAKVCIRMEGSNPEEAMANAESLAEDASISLPFGFDLEVGRYPAQMFFAEGGILVGRQLPEGVDPLKRARPTFSEYMKMCLSGDEDEECESESTK